MKRILSIITNKKILLNLLLLLVTISLIKATNNSLEIKKIPIVNAGCTCNSACSGSTGGNRCGPDPYCGYVSCSTGQDYCNAGCAPVVTSPNAPDCSVTGYSGNCFTIGPPGCKGTTTITSFEGSSCPTTQYLVSSSQGGAGTYCPSPGNTCGRNCNQVDQEITHGGVCACASANCGPTNTPIPTPTKVPCGGPCTNGNQCDLSCPICTAGGTCAAPSPTPTKVPCTGPCTNPSQCVIACPICTAGGKCAAPTPTPVPCGGPCTSSSQCVIACPICTAGGKCAAPSPTPTPTPIPCGGPCSPIGIGINPKCIIACPICAPGPNGGTCLAPTPTPIACGQPCSPQGPGINPKCDVTCPICTSGPGGSVVCIKPTPMPTPICGI